MSSLPDYVQFKPFPGIPLKDIFFAAGDDLLDLLDRLLDSNPNGRVNATQVTLAASSQGSYKPLNSLKMLEFESQTSRA